MFLGLRQIQAQQVELAQLALLVNRVCQELPRIQVPREILGQQVTWVLQDLRVMPQILVRLVRLAPQALQVPMAQLRILAQQVTQAPQALQDLKDLEDTRVILGQLASQGQLVLQGLLAMRQIQVPRV